MKYQLPAEQNVYVDLVDDEDTQLMFDEWHDWAISQNKSASAKLHLFVDWLRRGPAEQKERRFGDSVASLEHAGKERSSAGNTASRRLCWYQVELKDSRLNIRVVTVPLCNAAWIFPVEDLGALPEFITI